MKDDAPTLAAIGILAYVFADLLHEVGGHGLTCIATGAEPVLLTTLSFACSENGRLMVAAGTIANLVAGGLLALALRRLRGASVHLRYFLWLAMAFDLLNVGAYLVDSGATNTGDLAFVIRGLEPAGTWRIGLVVAGALAYYLGVLAVARGMRAVLGGDASPGRVWRLVWIPYLAAGLAACAGGLFNPIGIAFVVTAAAASSFGSGLGLLAMPRLVDGGASGETAEPLVRRLDWIAVAAFVLLAFVALLGPGLPLHR